MIMTRHTFENRKSELDVFLNYLSAIEESVEYTSEFCSILRSNSLLMMYNMVEATVMGGIEEIYDAVKTYGHNYRHVSSKIQSIWFSFKFNQVYDRNAHHNSYKEKATEIIDSILNNHVIDLPPKAVKNQGNLDAQVIRGICDDHGISFTSPPESRGGVRIAEVKDLRNSLAHGGKSFVECGRNFTISDLKSITYEIVKFLEGLLDGMSDYYDNQQWATV